MLSWGRNGCLRHAWLQATRSQREVLHTCVQIDTTIMNLLPAEKKNNLIKNQTNAKALKFHLQWHQDTNINSIPVAFSDAVEDGRFVFRPQTVGSCVAEKQPVSYTELRQQTTLNHLIQIISRRTPQTAGEQWLFCAQLLRKQHITHDH